MSPQEAREPVGEIHVVDPNELNWSSSSARARRARRLLGEAGWPKGRVDELVAASAEIDRFAYERALSIVLCAVNRHVSFKAHAATFELADTEVSEAYWSRRV